MRKVRETASVSEGCMLCALGAGGCSVMKEWRDERMDGVHVEEERRGCQIW